MFLGDRKHRRRFRAHALQRWLISWLVTELDLQLLCFVGAAKERLWEKAGPFAGSND